MNGVEILSSAQIACEFAFNWTAFSIAFGLTVCFIVLIGIVFIIHDEIEWWFITVWVIIGTVIGIMMGGVLGATEKTPTAYEIHYKVIIDDSVLMNEFLDKYEILDQEGKIYTVKERE